MTLIYQLVGGWGALYYKLPSGSWEEPGCVKVCLYYLLHQTASHGIFLLISDLTNGGSNPYQPP